MTLALVTEQGQDGQDSVDLRGTDVKWSLLNAQIRRMRRDQAPYERGDGRAILDEDLFWRMEV